MSLYVEPASVAVDGSCLVVLVGNANKAVEWSLTGAGTLTVIDKYTNAAGVAVAKYTPDNNEGSTVTVGVEYGI